MKTTLSLLWTLLALACGTTLSMGQTNSFHSGNPRIDEEMRQFEQQGFFRDLPPKIQWVVLQCCRTRLALWVNGFQQSSPNEPDKLAALDLQVWLLRNDGTAVASIKKPGLARGMATSFGNGHNGYTDSMVYSFAKVPVEDLAGVVIRANGKLYCYAVDQQKWEK